MSSKVTNRLNTREFLDSAAASANLDVKEFEKHVIVLEQAILDAVKDGKRVQLRGFGTFSPGSRKNQPVNFGDEKVVPIYHTMRFSPSKVIKDQLNDEK